MTKANRVHSTPPTNASAIPSRRGFLTQSVLAGAAAAVSLSIAPLAMAAIATEPDPVFAAIEAHKKARHAVEAGIAEQERLTALADAAVGPRHIMVPDMLNSPEVEPKDCPQVEVTCWIDLDKYVPAEANKRYRKQLEKQQAAHDEFLGDVDYLVNEPADVEWDVADELVETVPTTMAGLFALLVYVDAVMEDEPSTIDDRNIPALLSSLAEAAKALQSKPVAG